MSAKRFRRKDLKHDEFITLAGRVSSWLMQRRRRIAWGLLAVAVVLFVVLGLNLYHERMEQRAAELLAAAMEVYRAPVVPPVEAVPDEPAMPAEPAAERADTNGGGEAPGAPAAGGQETEPTAPTNEDPGEPAGAAEEEPAVAEEVAPPPPAPAAQILQYASDEEKYEAAKAHFAPIVNRYGSRPSGRVAAFYLGICETELGNREAAVTAFESAADGSQPLVATMALYRLGQLQLDAGAPNEAIAYFDQLLDRGRGVFPGEEALMAKARAHDEAGDPRAALAAYQRVVDDFGGSFSAIDAQTRVEEIAAQLGLDPDVEGL